MATVKHWADNHQERNRDEVSMNVDERTNFEMYYPAYEGTFEAGVGSLMCSYNKINQFWSCSNKETLDTHLR